jgi:hypothetical protein
VPLDGNSVVLSRAALGALRSAARLGGVATCGDASAYEALPMVRRQRLLSRLLGLLTWAVTLAVIVTVLLRSRSSQDERRAHHL